MLRSDMKHSATGKLYAIHHTGNYYNYYYYTTLAAAVATICYYYNSPFLSDVHTFHSSVWKSLPVPVQTVASLSLRRVCCSAFVTRYFLSPDQQSGIHCLIICAIQLMTPNNLGGT